MLTQTKITTKEQKNEEKLKSIVTYSNETENMEQITNSMNTKKSPYSNMRHCRAINSRLPSHEIIK